MLCTADAVLIAAHAENLAASCLHLEHGTMFSEPINLMKIELY